MNQQSWHWLMQEAECQSVRSGQKRYVVGERFHYQGWSGWVYNVVTPEEYMRHRMRSWGRGRS